MKSYNFFLLAFIFWNRYIIVRYQIALSIVNVGGCDHFILLSLSKIYIFMHSLLSICYCFYKAILN